MVEMLGLAMKTNTILTKWILTYVLDELKIDMAKIVEHKTSVLTIEVPKDDISSLVDEGVYNLVD